MPPPLLTGAVVVVVLAAAPAAVVVAVGRGEPNNAARLSATLLVLEGDTIV
jgi:hypothetical protein